MRSKLFIVILMISVAVCFGKPAFADIAIMAGADVMGSWEVSGDMEGDGDTDTGFFVGGEFSTSITPLISLGGGLRYQLQRSDTDATDAKWNFIPLYLLGHVNVPAGLVTIFGALHVGYNLLQGNDDFKGDADLGGGLYYAIGGGVELPMGLQFELLYGVNNGTLEQDGYSADFTASQISVSVGFKF